MTRRTIAIAIADVRQRTRTTALLGVPVVAAFLGHLLVADALVLVVDEATGEPTAAWIGGVMTAVGTIVLLLFGFPIATGGFERDEHHGIRPLVGTTNVRPIEYVVGKWASTVAVLWLLGGALALAAIGTFLSSGTGPLALADLLVPFVVILLPAMVLLASIATLFETVSILRGSAGTAIYVLLYLTSLTAIAAVGVGQGGPGGQSLPDPFGITILYESMSRALPASAEGGIFALTTAGEAERTFVWPGLVVTRAVSLDRVALLVGAVVLVGLSAVTVRLGPAATAETSTSSERNEPTNIETPAHVDAVPTSGPGLVGLLRAELRRRIGSRQRWWYVLIVGGIGLGLLAGRTAAPMVLAATWLLPLPVWSSLGADERTHRTMRLVETTPRPLARLWATWAAGATLGIVTAAGVLVSLSRAGALSEVGGVLLGAGFVSALALAMGQLTGRRRPFELCYLVLWYVGPVNATPPLDFTGLHGGPLVSVVFAGLTAGLLLLVVIDRRTTRSGRGLAWP